MTDRLMPVRKFYGMLGQSPIMGLLTNYVGGNRPLVENERILGAFILPPFQRPSVWTESQKVKLIESIYLGLPIGTLVVNMLNIVGPTDRWLLDGQQRVTAISEYVNGSFSVCGWRYPDLPDIEKRHFERIGVGIINTEIIDENECRDIYNRLAYGGTNHE